MLLLHFHCIAALLCCRSSDGVFEYGAWEEGDEAKPLWTQGEDVRYNHRRLVVSGQETNGSNPVAARAAAAGDRGQPSTATG